MTADLVCWSCGAPLGDLPLPLARLETCPACRADLHVCRLCELWDRSVARECREPIADDVHDKTRANFCGYFTPRRGAWQPDDGAAARRARAELEALFGTAPPDDGALPGESEAEAARRRLESLLGEAPPDDGTKDGGTR